MNASTLSQSKRAKGMPLAPLDGLGVLNPSGLGKSKRVEGLPALNSSELSLSKQAVDARGSPRRARGAGPQRGEPVEAR